MNLPSTASQVVELLGLIPHPEGGFFLETFRSGSVPMSSKGQTDLNVQDHCLVMTVGRESNRPDRDMRRNGLTSIYWMPTRKSPVQPLTKNESDHVHYYQGGLPFEYITYDPDTHALQRRILGPDLAAGHVLQLPVAGRLWKCGRQVSDYNGIEADYSLIGEAVGPAFDFHDFVFVDRQQVLDQVGDESMRTLLLAYVHGQVSMEEIDGHYTSESVKQTKTQERM